MARILVVDDEPDVLSLFVEALAEAGHAVETAENGREAVAKAEAFAPEVIVLDVFMPEKDGLEALIEIRKIGKPCRIVAVSGGGISRNFDFLDVSPVLGADVVVRKPVLPDQLVAHVHACLASAPGK